MQPVVILLVSGVIMFSVIGGLSLLAHYYTLNGIKSKTVGDGQHGTARFATKKEIEEYELGYCLLSVASPTSLLLNSNPGK